MYRGRNPKCRPPRDLVFCDPTSDQSYSSAAMGRIVYLHTQYDDFGL